MGIELEKFVHRIDDELKCSICYAVLEDPVQLTECEHTFCRPCIEEWIKRQSKCPIDRRDITIDSLRPGSRLLNSFLSRLEIRCDFENLGCNVINTLESKAHHMTECRFNPEKVFPCHKGCGLLLSAQQKIDHNCVLEDILINVENLNEKIRKLENIVEKQDKNFRNRIDCLEMKCQTIGQMETKYLLIENKYKDLVQNFLSLGISTDSVVNDNCHKTSNLMIQQKEQNVLTRAKSDRSPMKIMNIEIDHKKQTIEIWANIREPIRNIKQKIKILENIPIESQCLFSDNQQLIDEKSLEDYCLSSMNLVLVKRPINVDIILFNGNINFLLEPFDQISRLRDKIFNSKGFNVKLTYFGQLLDENRTFHSYKIRDRAKLKVVAIECNTGGPQSFGSK